MIVTYWLEEDLEPLIIREARTRNLPEAILLGLVEVESNFNPFAVIYEQHYRYTKIIDRLKPKDCSINTEINLQKTSFGLFQIMGGTARYMGFSGWLTRLLMPTINIKYGTLWFSRLYNKYSNEYGISGVIAAYNAGNPRISKGRFVNQSYVDKVLKAAKKY